MTTIKSTKKQLPHPNLKAPTFDYVPSEEQYEKMFVGAGRISCCRWCN